jgi:hypothetical protein
VDEKLTDKSKLPLVITCSALVAVTVAAQGACLCLRILHLPALLLPFAALVLTIASC